LAGLQAAGLEPYLDKHDVAPGEAWEARLGRLIEAADSVVFVISPDAVASKRCAWEVERTEELKKRLLPIVLRGVEEAQVPQSLRQLNYIFFDRPNAFGSSLLALTTALKTDITWVREHTRITEAALRWDARRRADAMLMRGEELSAAKEWLKAQPKYAPDPTLLQHEFIKAGEDAEAARMTAERQALEREKAALRSGQRRIGALMVMLALGGVGWWKQSFIREQVYWRVIMGPRVLTVAQEKEKAAMPGAEFTECAIGCPTMVVVPEGKFTMGSPEGEHGRFGDEGPQHAVTIAKPFAVGRTEVTFAEWDTCVDAGACPKAPDLGWGRKDRPVISVSWYDAKQYVAWLSRITGKEYRLLSEAEWEYAARAGNSGPYGRLNMLQQESAHTESQEQTPAGGYLDHGKYVPFSKATRGSQEHYSFADENVQLDQYAWYSSNSDGRTQPVGKKAANAFGLHDMHGNAEEWVEDTYHDSYNSYKGDRPNDGSPWVKEPLVKEPWLKDGRVVRGGSWYFNPQFLRASYRAGLTGGGQYDIVGFRLARTLNPTERESHVPPAPARLLNGGVGALAAGPSVVGGPGTGLVR
jgi:formylglycine-generating enzyme required for sulfatase activity